MSKCSHRCMVSKPITACSVTRWVSTPHGMKCPQRTKAVSAARPLERGLEDPRIERTKKHLLLDILVIAVCTLLTGGEGFQDMELFGKSKRVWLQTFLALPHGIPSHDTFGRVFARLNPQRFQESFLSWTRAVAALTQGTLVSLDGKTVKASFDRATASSPLHMLSAWCSANGGLVIGQTKTDSQSNEITAIPELLRLLAIKGCIVTIDAMGCQT